MGVLSLILLLVGAAGPPPTPAGLRGVVTDQAGRPVSGVVVHVERTPPGSEGHVPPVTSDSYGRFAFRGLPQGRYFLVALRAGEPLGIATGVVGPRGVDTNVRLEASRQVHGRLVDVEGRPIAGRVTAERVALVRSAVITKALATPTTPAGVFAIDRLPSGDHTLAASAPGFVTKRLDVVLRPSDRERKLGDVVLERGTVIAGRVMEGSGAGIGGATVAARSVQLTGREYQLQATTAGDGGFELGLPRGRAYRIDVSAPGYAPRTVGGGVRDELIDIVLEAVGRIAGTVVDADGNPTEWRRVEAAPLGAGEGKRATLAGNGPHPRGRFVVEDVVPGEYVVRVTAADGRSSVVSAVSVSAGAVVDLGRITLDSGALLRGQVVDVRGSGMSGAMITVGEAKTTTDDGGGFEIREAAPGLATVVATHPGYAAARASGVRLHPGEVTEVRLVLTEGGRVEGVARERGNAPVVNAPVAAMSEASAPSDALSVLTGPDGSFVIDHVPAGRTRVVLMRGDGSSAFAVQDRTVLVESGRTTRVDFVSGRIVISGSVKRNGAPLPDVTIRLDAIGDHARSYLPSPGSAVPGELQRMLAVTRHDGTYSMRVDEPGQYAAHFAMAGGALPVRTVEIPDAEASVADFHFSGGQVAGLVVDEDDRGVAGAEVVIVARAGRADPGQRAVTGGDGGFQLEVDGVEHRVSVRADGYAPATRTFSLDGAGSAELKVVLVRGTQLRGRVRDQDGRAMSGIKVQAVPLQRPAPLSSTTTLADGSFAVEGLGATPYILVAGTVAQDLFGIAGPIEPPATDVDVRVGLGGRIDLKVVGPQGAPMSGVIAMVTSAGGRRIDGAVGSSGTTGPSGIVTLRTVPGPVRIEAGTDELRGAVTTTVPEGGVVQAELHLQHAP